MSERIDRQSDYLIWTEVAESNNAGYSQYDTNQNNGS